MSIVVQCQRFIDGYGEDEPVQCGESAEIGLADGSSWHRIPFGVAGADTDGSPTIAVVLPDGWTADYVGHDSVIRCPEHSGS